MRANTHFRDVFEVTSVYGLILAVIWTPMPLQRVLFWTVFVWIILSTILRGENFHAMGMSLSGLWRSSWIVLAAFAFSVVAMFVAARVGTLHHLFGRSAPLGMRIGGYTIWAFLQEFILLVYILMRLLRVLASRTAAILIAASLFAVAHIPNPVLTALTLLWGVIACSLYLRYRNLFALTIAHAILGLCVAVTVPDAVHHHMRVGIGYLTYRPNTHMWAVHARRSPQ